jgi:hypothetical protein
MLSISTIADNRPVPDFGEEEQTSLQSQDLRVPIVDYQYLKMLTGRTGSHLSHNIDTIII